MMTDDAAIVPTGRRLTGRKVFLIFACFFGTIFVADGFLLFSALRTWSGAETSSAYRAGQLYNQEIRLAREQAERGWALEARVERDSGDGVRVTVEARGPEGRALTGRSLAASLQRPAFQRDDRSFLLDETSAGTYVADLRSVSAGQWELVVDVVEDGERAFRRKSRIILR